VIVLWTRNASGHRVRPSTVADVKCRGPDWNRYVACATGRHTGGGRARSGRGRSGDGGCV